MTSVASQRAVIRILSDPRIGEGQAHGVDPDAQHLSFLFSSLLRLPPWTSQINQQMCSTWQNHPENVRPLIWFNSSSTLSTGVCLSKGSPVDQLPYRILTTIPASSPTSLAFCPAARHTIIQRRDKESSKRGWEGKASETHRQARDPGTHTRWSVHSRPSTGGP
jgi:hypothetical protein